MTLPALLIPTLDALLTSGGRWLPLGEAEHFFPRVRYLRAAHQDWFDLVGIRDGQPTLDWMGEVKKLYERAPALFAPALAQGVLEPIPLEGELLERARFVDGIFPSLWAGLERGTIDAETNSYDDSAALRRVDGSYWSVHERGGQLVSADQMPPAHFAWLLRSRLWEGKSPRTRPLSSALQARLDEVLSVDAILRAPLVDVKLRSSTLTSGDYRLQGRDAFRLEETGERPSADYTSAYPEIIYDYLPCSRAQVEQAMRDGSAVVLKVDYSTGGISDAETRWRRCSICRELPTSARESWSRGTCEEALPAAASKLVVVGAPYFNDHADRGQCTKRCPECGTIYAWGRDYELEVAAMVDTIDVYLRRLDEVAGAAAVESASAEVARRASQFQIDGARWVSVALQSNDPVVVERAVGDLLHHQSLYGEDLSFAVPALVHALALHKHTNGWIRSPGYKMPKCDLGRSVMEGLEKVARCGPAQRDLVLATLKLLKPGERRPETKELLLLLPSLVHPRS